MRAGLARPLEEDTISLDRLLHFHLPPDSAARAGVRHVERNGCLRHSAGGVARTRPNANFVGVFRMFA